MMADPDVPRASTTVVAALTDIARVAVEGPSEEKSVADASRQRRQDFLATARRRWMTCHADEQDRRREAVEDQKFRAGQQWLPDVVAARVLDRRPCLTINRLMQPVSLVVNQQRQSKIGIEVTPVDDDADVETAEVLQGLIRHIEQQSNAEMAYDTAFEHAAVSGWGYIRVMAQFEPGSFDQELQIRRFLNPMMVYVDPAVQEPDYADARYVFVVTDMPKDEFTTLYPTADPASLEAYESIGDRTIEAGWMPEGKIRVAEYWYVEETDRPLVQVDLGGGRTASMPADEMPEGALVLRKRMERERHVRCAIITAADVLEEFEWAGQWIPIVPVLGTEIIVDGKRDLRGMIRDARDPQRAYNYWVTAATEAIALAPRAPFVGAEGQFEGHEKEWQQANTRNLPYLEYKPVSLAGQLPPPPERQTVEPPIQAMMVAVRQADNDLKATTGLFDPSLGERGPQQSGKAIIALQKQGELASGNLGDNLARAVRHVGRILIDLIPKIYDTARVIRIIGGENEPPKSVAINQPTMVDGVQRIYDLSVGRYDVTVTMGQGYATRRQEAAERGVELVQANPALMTVIGDLIVESMDWPNAPAIAERLRKALPPQLQDQEDGQQAIPPQVQAQMQQLAEQNGALTEALNAAQQELQSKRDELASRERIAEMQMRTMIAVTEAKIESAEDIALLKAKTDELQARMQGAQRSMEGAASRRDQSFDRDQDRQSRERSEQERAKTAAQKSEKKPEAKT